MTQALNKKKKNGIEKRKIPVVKIKNLENK